MRFIFVFFLTISLVPSVLARQIEGLYDARVVVANQSSQARKKGAQKGLLDVLYKVSGFPVPAGNSVIRGAYNKADQYIYQFSFNRTEESDWGDDVPPGSSYLNMKFEGKSIQRIIKQAQLPRWGVNRPSIMTWIAVADGSREMLTEASEHKALKLLTVAAKKRGLALVLPVYDLEDAMKLPMEQLWGLFKEGILNASERYGAESVLAGRVYQPDESSWVGNWRFYFKGQEYEYEYKSETLAEQLQWGVSAGGGVLADAFALKPSAKKRDSLMVNITNVQRLEDYGHLLTYLKKLAVTKQVSLIKMTGDEVLIELSLNGTFDQFKQSLSLDKKLVAQKSTKPAAKTDLSSVLSSLIGEAGVITEPAVEPENTIVNFKWRR
jgi:hypothetical protein